MNPKRTRFRKIALGSIIVAAVAFLAAYYFGQRFCWVALNEPIRLEEGFELSRQFTANVAADYWVMIECRQAVSPETLDRLLRIEPAVERSVLEDGKETGRSDFGYGLSNGSYTSRRMWCFDGVPGRSYMLKLRVLRSLPDIAPIQATVKIKASPRSSMVWYLSSALCQCLMAVSAFVSLIFFGTSFLFRRQPVAG